MNEYLGIFIDEDEGEEITTALIPFIPKIGDVFIIESKKEESIALRIKNINYVILNKDDSDESNKLEHIRFYCSKENEFGK